MEASWLDVKAKLGVIFCGLAQEVDGFDRDFDPEIRVADPYFGDFLNFFKNNILVKWKRVG
jgi:hypothetical protein